LEPKVTLKQILSIEENQYSDTNKEKLSVEPPIVHDNEQSKEIVCEIKNFKYNSKPAAN